MVILRGFCINTFTCANTNILRVEWSALYLSRQMSIAVVQCQTIRCPLRCMWFIGRFVGKGRNQSFSQPMLWTTCQFQCGSWIRTRHLMLTVPTSLTT